MIRRNGAYIAAKVLRLLEAEENPEAQELVYDWISAGEVDVYSRLRAHWMVRAATVTVNTDSEFQLPPSWLEMITIFPLATGVPLDSIAAEQAGPLFVKSGPPEGYLIEGLLCTILPRQPETQYRLTYYSQDREIQGAADSSMLTEQAPWALIYAAARHGAIHLGEDGEKWAADATSIIDPINEMTASARFGGGLIIRR